MAYLLKIKENTPLTKQKVYYLNFLKRFQGVSNSTFLTKGAKKKRPQVEEKFFSITSRGEKSVFDPLGRKIIFVSQDHES